MLTRKEIMKINEIADDLEKTIGKMYGVKFEDDPKQTFSRVASTADGEMFITKTGYSLRSGPIIVAVKYPLSVKFDAADFKSKVSKAGAASGYEIKPYITVDVDENHRDTLFYVDETVKESISEASLKTFKIEITETLQRQVTAKAVDSETARSMVKNQYDNGEIVLDADDMVEVEIEPVE